MSDDLTVAFDTETTGLDWQHDNAFLGSWATSKSSGVCNLTTPHGRAEFAQILSDAKTLVAHNLSFDLHMVRESIDWEPAPWQELHDTDLISRIVLPGGAGSRNNHRLKNLAVTLIDPHAADAEQDIAAKAEALGTTLNTPGAYYDVWRAYPLVMEAYAEQDAVITLQLYHLLWDKLVNDSRAMGVYQLEWNVQPILYQAEIDGVEINLAAAERLRQTYEPQLHEVRERLIATLGEKALGGPGSEQALIDGLLEQGVPLTRKTESGKLATNKFALQPFEEDYPVVSDLMEFRRLSKFLDTYLKPMLDSGGTLHTRFHQCNAWTGRMSTSNPNTQNLPKRAGKEVRSPIVPREGYAFVVCDYDGIEARLLAYYMADEEYREFFRRGDDPHAWMATMINGGEMADYHEGSPKRPLRDEAKNTLFAISYGAGAPRVADMNKIDRESAKALIAKIKSSLPKYRPLMSRIRKKVEHEGAVHTLFGRTQRVSKDKAYVGLNALIQGSAADIMKQGLVNVNDAVRPLGGRVLLVVHDEVVVEVPLLKAHEALDRTIAAMEAAADLDPPLKVSGSVVTTNYAEA